MIPEKAQLAIARIENGKVKYVGLQKLDGKVYAIVNKETRFKSMKIDDLLSSVLCNQYAKNSRGLINMSITDLAQHTGYCYEDMVRKKILEPLGMTNSTFDADMSLVTTASDLSKFAIFCLELRISTVNIGQELSSLLLDGRRQFAFLVLSDLDYELCSSVIKPFCHPMLVGEGIGRLIKAI